jgi:hypothetical protein
MREAGPKSPHWRARASTWKLLKSSGSTINCLRRLRRRAAYADAPIGMRPAFPSAERDRHLGIRPVSQLNTWPAVASVNASRLSSLSKVLICTAVFSVGLLVGAGFAVWIVPPA